MRKISRVLFVCAAHEPFHRDGWVYEEKYDGWRMIAYKDGARGPTHNDGGVARV